MGSQGLYPEQKKREILKEVCLEHNIKILVETGTYHGETCKFLSPYLEQIYTIELKEDTYNIAKANLYDCKNVTQYLGDALNILPTIIPLINKKALFWLDAHWFGKAPLIENLEQIPKGHIIMIDDLDELERWENPDISSMYDICEKLFPDYTIYHMNEIMYIIPEIK